MKTVEYEIWFCKNPRINDSEIDKDVRRAIVHASLNLKYRYDIDLEQIGFNGPVYKIRVTGPDNLIDNFSCMRLKGIATYLLKHSDNKEKYKNMQVGKRLISYLKTYSCNSVKTGDYERNKSEINAKLGEMRKLEEELNLLGCLVEVNLRDD